MTTFNAPEAYSWRQLIRSALAAVLPRRWFITSGPAESGDIAITFDDGPDPDHTPRILDALQRLHIPATFFVIGQKAERHPDLVRRMIAEGHAVGHHTYWHAHPSRVSALQLWREVRETRRILADLTGHAPRLFRPPLGLLTISKMLALWAARQGIVLWNVDPRDYASADAEQVLAWFSGRVLNGGDIILLHDNHPHATEVLPHLAARARASKLAFTTVCRWTDDAHLGDERVRLPLELQRESV